MSQVIGKVRLQKGRVGYFDELTRIHLTISKPEALVIAGMNTSNLKRAVRGGVLRLVTGSLELEQTKVVKDVHVTEVTKAAKEVVEEKVATITEAPEAPVEKAKAVETVEVKQEPVVEEAPVEEALVKESKIEETAKPKANSRKKKAAEDK